MKRLLYILSILLCLASCKEDEVIISQHGTTYDTVRVNVRQNLYDTVRQLIYDTTRTKVYDTVHATVNDTVWNHQTITSYDTIRTLISDTITIKNYDTVRIVKTITNYDTVRTVIKDTVITKINDTIWSHRTINDTVWDYQTVVKYDTVRTKVNDTVWITKNDTIKIQIIDTVKISINPNRLIFDGTVDEFANYLASLNNQNIIIDAMIVDRTPNLEKLKTIILNYRDKNFGSKINLNLELCTGLTKISEEAFKLCWNLTEIILPETIVEIEHTAFNYCSALTTMTLPSGVKSIGWRAFLNCTKMTSLIFKSQQPPAIAEWLGYKGTIYVPQSSLADYKNDKDWGRYDYKIVGY